MIKFFLFILMIILLFVIAMTPRYYNREDFIQDDIMSISKDVKDFKIRGPSNNLTFDIPDVKPLEIKPLSKPIDISQMPPPKPQQTQQVKRQQQTQRQQQQDEQRRCDCDCNDLRQKIELGCSEIQAQYDQCSVRLLDAESTCENEKGQIQQINEYRLSTLERDMQKKEKELTDLMTEVQECSSRFNQANAKNNTLLSENTNLRKQLVGIQGMISQSGADTGQCQQQYAELSKRYDDLSSRFVQTADQYRGATEGLRDLSDSYTQLKQKVDQCTK